MTPDTRTLLHTLNNQLGIVLVHAELLESKAVSPEDRNRASRVVASTLDALKTARELQSALDS